MGLQDGRQCWCGTEGDEEKHIQYGQVDTCDMLCPGDSSQTCGYSDFSITIQYEGDWTQSREDLFEAAASRWAEVLTHIPCTGTSEWGDDAGVLRITATLEVIDGVDGSLGQAAPEGVWSECEGISYYGFMRFDIDDVERLETDGTLFGIVLHEMGHVIGIGTLWGECSDCFYSGSDEWTCPLAAEVYNNLAGNDPDSPADIIQATGKEGERATKHYTSSRR
eukprot:g12641.t1